jgi:hypothetical protein
VSTVVNAGVAIATSCAFLWVGASDAVQRAFDVACSPSSLLVSAPSETIRVTAWVDPDEARSPMRFRWTATVGTIAASGSDVAWTIVADANSRPPYRATVRAEHAGNAGVCTVEVWPTTQGRGPAQREAAKKLITAREQVPDGYGLYSYLLLGSGPTDANRERYVKTIEAWWSLVPDLVQLERYLKPQQLNAALLPVMAKPADMASADALLEHYDYARARVLLRAVGRTDRDGPYFVSSLSPLKEGTDTAGPSLVQDLSSIPPSLAVAWTKEFLNQTSQERFWDERTAPMLGLRLRTIIRVLSEDVSDVRHSVGALITWRGATRK